MEEGTEKVVGEIYKDMVTAVMVMGAEEICKDMVGMEKEKAVEVICNKEVGAMEKAKAETWEYRVEEMMAPEGVANYNRREVGETLRVGVATCSNKVETTGALVAEASDTNAAAGGGKTVVGKHENMGCGQQHWLLPSIRPWHKQVEAIAVAPPGLPYLETKTLLVN